MKTKIILLAVIAFLTSACSSSWLDTNPTGEIPDKDALGSTSALYKALNGVNNLTVQQYLSSQGFNGEGTIKIWYGDYPGRYFVKDLPGWAAIINSRYMENTVSIYNYYPWFYYYKLLANVNNILAFVDDAEGAESDINEIKGRALTYRAYSYLRLTEIYCKRWSDSDNGSSRGVILKDENNYKEEQLGLSTLGDIYSQIYKDLDSAIEYLKEGNPSSDFFDMSLSAAYAVYARAALTKNDYVKAASMAKLAREGHPLMSNDEYLAGFNNPNSEWIWGSFNSESQNKHFFAHLAYLGFDANTSIIKSYPIAMAKSLYRQIPKTDVRRKLWFDPGNDTDLNGDATDEVATKVRKEHPTLTSGHIVSNYMQFKFKVTAQPGVGSFNNFRSSEMYLIEAEALVRENKGLEAEAQKLLTQLIKDSGRDPDYVANKTGQALIDEIMFYRAIELWGEGFDWFDAKRTKTPIVRTLREKSEQGDFIQDLYTSDCLDVNAHNSWSWSIPDKETDFNSQLDEK